MPPVGVTQGGGTQSEGVYCRHADLFMSVLMHKQPPSNPASAHTHIHTQSQRDYKLSALLCVPF